MDEKKFNKFLPKANSNSHAFTELYEFYLPKIIVHTVRKFRVDETFGEDVAQDFFVKLLQMEINERIEKPTSWVFTISDNVAKNIFPKRNKEILVSSNLARNLAKTPFEQETYGDYSEKLNQLDEITREIIILFKWEGYSLKEISEIMNISYVSVRQKYSRGIKKLRK